MNRRVKAYKSALELIGKTPLLKLNNIVKNIPGNFYAKVEAFNPGHSNKDRIALALTDDKGTFMSLSSVKISIQLGID